MKCAVRFWGAAVAVCLVVSCTEDDGADQARATDDDGSSPVDEAGDPANDDPASTDTDAAASDLPCDVRQVLQTHCWECHGSQPLFGAPMSLVTVADLTAEASTGAAMAQAVLARVDDDQDPMPEAPRPRLTADERAVLQAWVDAATPAAGANDDCDGLQSDDTPGNDPDPGLPGSDAGNTPPTDTTDFDPSQCDATASFVAHGGTGANDDTPYLVPQQADRYQCFEFRSPWDVPVHALQFKPVVDDARVLHHWLLYQQDGEGTDGDSYGCSGTHPGAVLIAGWAPGNQDLTMPEGVGMELPSGEDSYYVLEIHYNNQAGYDDALDRSGVEICATTQLREQTAATHWLGTENIFLRGGRESRESTCVNNSGAPIHLLSVFPHMHKLGTASSMTLMRAEGGRQTLQDGPFSFADQRNYPINTVLQPGDSLVSRCEWNNTTGGLVTFGPGTDDEMCYLYVVAYPAGALVGGSAITTGRNTCIDNGF